jgi:hypothetical protein
MGYKTGFPRYLLNSSSFKFRIFRSLGKYNIFPSSSVYWHLVPQATVCNHEIKVATFIAKSRFANLRYVPFAINNIPSFLLFIPREYVSSF